MGLISGRDGNQIHYQEFRFAFPWEERRPVVLVHGLGCNWTIWLKQIPFLAATRRVVAVDCRGSGLSRPARQLWSMWDMAADVHAVVRHLALDKPDLVGLSMGGAVAMHYAIEYPEALTRLVTLGAPAGPIEAVRDMRARDFEFIMANPIEVIARKRMERAFSGSPDARIKEWVIAMISAMDIDDYRSQANAGTTMTLHERLEGIRAPHEIINGEAESVVVRAVAQYIPARSRQSRLHLIPGARHFWSLEEPEACNALLAQLLEA